MATVLEKPEAKALQGALLIRYPKNRVLDDDALLALSSANPELRFEQTAQGDLIIMRPAGTETGGYDAELVAQLVVWAKQNGKGKAFGSSTGFRLPNGALRSPDASWVSYEKLSKLTPEQYKKFAPLCPEFLIELMSPSDSLKDAQEKMLEYISNGAELGWLIDPSEKCVYVYRASGAETLEQPESVAGVGRLEGFVLNLQDIW
jgi:Uma2 family endonuclease